MKTIGVSGLAGLVGVLSYLSYREIRKEPLDSQAAGSGEHSSRPVTPATASNGSPEMARLHNTAEKSGAEAETLPRIPRPANAAPGASQPNGTRPKLQQASIRRQAPAPAAEPDILFVQVAAVTQEADAYKVLAALKQKSFAAFISPPVNDGFYRVQLGPYQTREAARAGLKALEQAGYKPFIRR